MFRRFLSTYPKYTVHSKQYTPIGRTVGDNTKVKTIPAPAPAPKPPPVPPPSGVWFIP